MEKKIILLLLIILTKSYTFINAQQTLNLPKKIKNKYFIMFNKNLAYEVVEEKYGVIKAGNYKDEKTSFSLFISDYNNNKTFGDKGDLLGVVKYDSDTTQMLYRFINNVIIKDQTQFIVQSDGFNYLVKNIDPKGNFLEISPTDNQIPFDIKKFESVPEKITFELLNEKKTDFTPYFNKGKYVYVEIWGEWCRPCVTGTDSLKIVYQKYKHKLEIIGLNDKDTKEQVEKFVKKKNIDWVIGYTNQTLNNELCQNGYPYGILFDEKGKIIQKIHPENLEKWLDKNLKL